MKPYGTQKECIKCGTSGLSVEHHVTHQEAGSFNRLNKEEHMRIECSKCGFGWEEAPLNPDTE